MKRLVLIAAVLCLPATCRADSEPPRAFVRQAAVWAGADEVAPRWRRVIRDDGPAALVFGVLLRAVRVR